MDETLINELRQEVKRARRIELWIGVKKAFKERCKYYDNWTLNRWQRLFYTAKCLICVALFLKWKPKYGSYPDEIKVSTIYSRKLYAGWEACWLTVGYGIFKNWFYQITTDGDWWM